MCTNIGNVPFRLLPKFKPSLIPLRRIQGTGNPGSGAGRGGGGGGSIRESGGGLGEYGVAQEEGYFHKQQMDLLKKIKEKLKSAPKKPPTAEQKPEPHSKH